MKRLLIGLLGTALIAAVPATSSADQRGGGGARQGSGGGATAGPSSAPRGPQTPAPKHPDVKQGNQNADRVQQRTRDLERHAAGGDSIRTMTRDRDRIREQIQSMEKAHQRWRDGLGEQDRTRLRDQLRDMDQTHDRLRSRLADLDAALMAPSPDRERIRELARQIARETDTWRNTWRAAAPDTPPAAR